MFDRELETQVLDFIQDRGSVLGVELAEAFDRKYFELWRLTQNSAKIYTTHFSRWYLRVDAEVEGYARLSPSILRAFLTYTRFSTLENIEQAQHDARKQRKFHVAVSEKKRQIARDLLDEFIPEELLSRIGVLIAGDVCRDMAHEVPRPERSTGEMVKGSDIDLIFVIGADDKALCNELDTILLEAKNVYLRHPAYREELDFVVNSLDHYRRVSVFETPKQMISCKAALEGQYLADDRELIMQAREILLRADIPRKVLDLSERAFSERLQSVERLRKNPEWINSPQEKRFFYFSDEIWEFMLE